MKIIFILLVFVVGMVVMEQVFVVNLFVKLFGYIDQFEIIQIVDVFGGVILVGVIGFYQLILGVVYGKFNLFYLDNVSIIDFDKVFRDVYGYVFYMIDFVILCLKLVIQVCCVFFYDVVNCGCKLVEEFFIGGKFLCNGLVFGDIYFFLLCVGYIIVWSGWQGDLK